MITKMKKYTFLVFHQEYEAFLTQLREVGVIHVTEKASGIADDEKLQHLITEAEKIRKTLTQGAPEQFINEKNALEQRITLISQEVNKMAIWGDFSAERIAQLKEAGYTLRYFTCPKKLFQEEWGIVVAEQGATVYFVQVNNTDEAPEGCQEQYLNEKSAANLQKDVEGLNGLLVAQNARIELWAKENIPALEKQLLEVNQLIDWQRVKLNTTNLVDGSLKLLEGYCPVDQELMLNKMLTTQNVYFQAEDPTPEDDIPIKLSNNKFFRLFEPLTKLYMLPKYGELDLTMFFAPFFMVFFGLCLGDMGYGALIMLALPIFTKLFQLINPEFKSSLVFLFGLSTVICGTLTGTAFGFSLYDIDLPFFQKMKDLLYQDNQSMFYLSLIIGCVQILFGMMLKAVNLAIQLGFKYAISTIGWIILLIAVAVAVLTNSLNSIWFIVSMIIAGCMVLLYNSPGKNIFLNIGLGLWDAYNMVTGLLGDVLSYVRLFALGLSGGILASVFNSLATGMSPDIPVVGFIVTALIFVIGHGLNIFMNILGSMVHPMRLTFVEFFKNSGYEGGGSPYKPFKK